MDVTTRVIEPPPIDFFYHIFLSFIEKGGGVIIPYNTGAIFLNWKYDLRIEAIEHSLEEQKLTNLIIFSRA